MHVEAMHATERVRAAFSEQAQWCKRLGSPFTALVCETFAERLSDSSVIGSAILNWPGDASPQADALALRVTGALHALAREKQHPELSALYPPAAAPTAEVLWMAVEPLLQREQVHFGKYLATAPQTNEVGRAAVFMVGLLFVASHFQLPIHLFEIGASAGLNLVLDRYRYRFGTAEWGPNDARLSLQPAWRGPPPAVAAPLHIEQRRGVDINPLTIADPEKRARLVSYVWADQIDRLQRLAAAIETALETPPVVESMDAAEWVEQQLVIPSRTGVTQVLMHSVVWNYLSVQSRERITAHLTRRAVDATDQQAIAWLRFEMDEASNEYLLSVTLWPRGDTTILAKAQAHGAWIEHLS